MRPTCSARPSAHHSLTFTIPFSRIQLADYLNCDRSALSRELSTMQRDGLHRHLPAAASSCWSRMPCSRWCCDSL
ncbi:MAG: helix-turn-helix domain-containing protein [Faecalibacterium prausnitzii]